MNRASDIHLCDDPRSLALAAAKRWETLAGEAVQARGAFHVALAGGSTPRVLYELLASPEWRPRMEWPATWVWFGDERCVPPDHPDSNYRMAYDTLLSRVDCPPSQVQRMEGERDPASAARDYARLLRERLPRDDAGSPPRFDLVLLGLGPDGHIASLFPDTALLDEASALAGAVFVPKLGAWRISLTYPVLDAARHVAMMVAGAEKSGIVAEAFGREAARYPVGRLDPAGRLEWYVDAAAAAGLDRREIAP